MKKLINKYQVGGWFPIGYDNTIYRPTYGTMLPEVKVHPYTAQLLTYPFFNKLFPTSHSKLKVRDYKGNEIQISRRSNYPYYNFLFNNCADLVGETLNLNIKGITSPNDIRKLVLKSRDGVINKINNKVNVDSFPISKKEYERARNAESRERAITEDPNLKYLTEYNLDYFSF